MFERTRIPVLASTTVAACVIGLAMPVAGDPGLPRPQQAVELTQRGVELIGEQKLDEAIAAFDAAIEADGSYGLAYYQRGRALALKGDMQAAQESLLRSTVLNPGFAHGHQLTALAAQRTGDFDTAWDQAIRAVVAGVEASVFAGLNEASPAPADFADRIAVPKVFVVGVDTRDLLTGDELPDNARGGVVDIRSVLGQVQPDLIDLQLVVTNAISDTPGFGLVPTADMAEYLLVIVAESVDADPRATMDGEIRLLRVADDNDVAFVQPVSFNNLGAQSSVEVEVGQFIDRLENWGRQAR